MIRRMKNHTAKKEERISEQLKYRQKKEALIRMEIMGVPVQIQNDYEQFGRILLSVSPHGTYSDLSDNMKDEIKKFEERNNSIVFMVIRAFSRAGKVDSLLFVGGNNKEWENEKNSIRNGYIAAYTINRDYNVCPGYENIVYHRMNDGGIIRLN